MTEYIFYLKAIFLLTETPEQQSERLLLILNRIWEGKQAFRLLKIIETH